MTEMVDPAAPARRRRHGLDQDLVVVDRGPRGRRRLARRCARPRPTSATARAPGFASGDARAFDEPARLRGARRLGLNQWALAGGWTVARHAAVSNERRRADRVPLPRARPQPRHGARATRGARSRSGCSSTVSRAGAAARGRCGRRRQRHRSGPAHVSADPPTRRDRRPGLRDRVPRRRRGGVLLHVRVGTARRLHAARAVDPNAFATVD